MPAEGITAGSTIVALGGGLGALLVTSVIRIYCGPLIDYFASKTLGRVVRGTQYNVRGTWKSSYNYPSRGKQKRTTQLMQLTQIGPNAYGKNIGSNSPHKHSMTLKLDGSYLTGTWRNTSSGAGHHGAVQFRILLMISSTGSLDGMAVRGFSFA
jgi:hypothetical protein